MKLESQVFLSHALPEPGRIEPVTSEVFWKPSGGLWTSTLDDEGGQWVRWVLGEMGPESLSDERWGGQLWLLRPAEANIAVVATPKDLHKLAAEYPYPDPPNASDGQPFKSFRLLLDWSAVARDYDAVHVPNPWPWRFGTDLAASMFFYSMDAECTCWFRWCFEDAPQELDPTPFLTRVAEEAL